MFFLRVLIHHYSILPQTAYRIAPVPLQQRVPAVPFVAQVAHLPHQGLNWVELLEALENAILQLCRRPPDSIRHHSEHPPKLLAQPRTVGHLVEGRAVEGGAEQVELAVTQQPAPLRPREAPSLGLGHRRT